MNKPRIIAAHAGCGKSYFCETNSNAIDFIIMPFKYSNFYELVSAKEGKENLKASDELDFIYNWQDAYYEALLDTYNTYTDEIIVIPAEKETLNRLYNDGIPYLLVYPREDLKEEYRQRYIQRGDSENFLYIFIDCWDSWMRILKKFEGCQRIELQEGQYLSDVVDGSTYGKESIIKNKEEYIYNTYFNK